MTTDKINTIETNGLTVGQFVEQLNKKDGFEHSADGFKMNIGKPREEVVEPDAQTILDEVGK